MSRWRDIAVLAAIAGLCAAAAVIAQTPPHVSVSAVGAPAGGGKLGIGREAKPDEIAGWDIDVRPDGHGLPAGKGTVKQGEQIYLAQCAACHGEFGESAGRWPILSGGAGTLASHDPVKSIGSYWPYASTVLDYIRRAMPYGKAQSLSNDELYAVAAYVLYLNDIIKDEEFELSAKNFAAIKLPNEANFFDDDRETTERAFWTKDPCMTKCAPGDAKVTSRARALDVTPDSGKGPKVE
jgi:cytochrome c